MNSILAAATLPAPSADVATVGRSAVEAILEPDAAGDACDELERRRAKMTQAILEPDAAGDEVVCSKVKAADLMFDPDALDGEAALQSVPILAPKSLSQSSLPAA